MLISSGSSPARVTHSPARPIGSAALSESAYMSPSACAMYRLAVAMTASGLVSP